MCYGLLSRPQRAAGFTKIELLVVVGVILIAIGLLLPFVRREQRSNCYMQTSSQVRGMHQSMVIYAQNNNSHLPGLDGDGKLLKANDSAFSGVPGNTATGASMTGRYYLLLHGEYISSSLMVSPQDTFKPADPKKMPSVDQFSYVLLRIGESATGTDIGTHAARASEWRDNANDQAILMSDRNTGPAATSNQTRSVWSTSTTTGPAWKGWVLWGDNHAEFLDSPHARLGKFGLSTKYAGIVNSDDFLFGSQDAPGKAGNASAMFGYTTENY